ncbi:MAG: hypothetical protein UT32_C0025G0017 [Parcubacteria group bacterium GW2011_GWC2_39_14]|nr:MAG: hypothetical protein UT32_C0025G0017 [Parcubacteria group bacterium GW2011_GWC2_39_14]
MLSQLPLTFNEYVLSLVGNQKRRRKMIRVKVKSKMMGCREVAKVFESLSLKAEDLTGQSFNLTKIRHVPKLIF